MSKIYSDINLVLRLVFDLFREMEASLPTKAESENMRKVKTWSSAHRQKRQSYLFRLLKGN